MKALRPLIEKSGDDEILVTFDQPQRAVTPGQAAVFYDGGCGGRRRLDQLKRNAENGQMKEGRRVPRTI